MPGKIVQCSSCLKTMRSDNLHRHLKSCKSFHLGTTDIDHPVIGQKRSPTTFRREEAPKKLKIQALADAIINDSSRGMVSRDLAKHVPTHTPLRENPLAAPTADTLPLATSEIAANAFKIPRTKADIIGYGDSDSDEEEEDNSEEDEDDDSEEEDECDDEHGYGSTKVKFLPETVQGLHDSFNNLPRA